ncbi:MAG: hypothetical protein IJ083_18150 [Clostridia bacterium]|nr:hypothetical protein [Clostridia bacterium]
MNQESVEVLAKRNAKDTVFIDLFHISKYRFLLFKALHPEMKDVTEKDVVPITLRPIITDQPYNDLGLLVKDRLLIFVEAQSTWTLNILIRILLYLAMTYQNYITQNNLNVYQSKKLDMPEPEFYVIYTGNRKIKKDTISLKEDFWHHSNARIDITVKIIYAENKDDIIGQYIIFSHVLDRQIEKYGRSQTAVEETIRICKSEGVLKEYLENREEEVITIMITLFSQEYAVEAYANDRERAGEQRGFQRGEKSGFQRGEKSGFQRGEQRGKIRGAVETYQTLGRSIEEAIHGLISAYNLSKKESAKYVKEYWKQ